MHACVSVRGAVVPSPVVWAVACCSVRAVCLPLVVNPVVCVLRSARLQD
jgi:hypothetical protein